MRKLLWTGLLVSLFMPGLATAQSAFDGTWKINMNKVELPERPDVFLLQNGMYECKTCTPPIKVKADGQDQAVSGDPYLDTAAIKVISDHEIQETDKKNGKTVTTQKTIVSPAGNTMTFEFTDSSNSNAAPVTAKGEATRVAKGPAGSHAISGSWRTVKYETLSDNAITWTYKVSGDELTMTNPTGQSYTAKMDGTEAPYKGDPGTTSVSVKMIGKDTLEETRKRGDKVIVVWKTTLAPDGKTAKSVFEDKLGGTSTQWV